jgi:hypothetical protein
MKNFMQHPYWTEVLSIPQTGTNKYLYAFTKQPAEVQHRFLDLVLEGFYPVSYSSPMAFLRVSELAEEGEAKSAARYIYEVELGMHPFIKNSKYQNVLHCVQLQQTVASLIDNATIEKAHPDSHRLTQLLSLQDADLLTALAVCDEIEHQAPQVIVCFQDLVAQWQYLTNRSSDKIDRIYLDEHGLTEGTDEEDQHVEIVERIKSPFTHLTATAQYEEKKRWYNELCISHINGVYNSINDLLRTAM